MLRETPVNIALVLLLLTVPVAASAMDEPFIVTLATKVAIFATAAVGLNIALGHGGLVSFGHAAFFGIGGYGAGILASHAQNYEPLMTWPFTVEGTQQMLIIWPVALLAGGIAALAIGALSLRTSGVYFIMITLAFAQMVFYFAVSWPAYGGEDGLPIYVRNSFPGLNTLRPLDFFAVAFVWFLAATLFSILLSRSRFGLALQGARQNVERVRAVGIDPYRLRLVAFTISGMITALAGALYADLNRFVSPSMLSWQTSGEIMVFIILGGVGRHFGPLAGAALFILLEYALGGVSEYWKFLLGVLLLLVVLFAHGGLIGVVTRRRHHG
ncbi:branched-chain amino acid ABC transporter permease [Oricola nitratireducens]|uniref:branched-chain amino acid ABC transporter permease n=1 Tax=Oricola nitratireducens TaxID=2775868 RepID=UPI0018662D3D|nr:branched-chain amino acid ABC transporter permease [Oricola nitratireducens]